jgi:hypothetical protein
MRRRNESGQALILAAVSMVVLIGFIGLGVDMGVMRHEKRILQGVADSAAIGGASELNYGDVTVGAQNAAKQNGFVDGSNGATLTVNNPPQSGPHKNNLQYVEVIASQVAPTYFMKLFRIDSVNINARAVAYLGDSTGCIYALNQTKTNAILMNGSGKVQANCGVYDDSKASQALLNNGSGTLTAKSVGVVGNYLNNGSGKITPTPATGMVPLADPLSYLDPPSVKGSCSGGTQIANGSGTYTFNPGNVIINGSPTVTLNPGEYCQLTLNGSPNVTFNSGTYILDQGVTFNGTTTVTANDVTFYVNSGGVTLNGNNSSNFTAPTAGAYAGILVYQSSSDTSQLTINGSNSLNLTGAIYAPKANVTDNGSSATSAYSIIVADSITFNGSLTFNDNYSTLPSGSPIKAAMLVE